MKNKYIEDLEKGLAFVGFRKNKGPGSKTDLMFHARRMNEIIEQLNCKKAVELGTGRGQGCVLLSHSVNKDGIVYTTDNRLKNQGIVKKIREKYPSSIPIKTFHMISTDSKFVEKVMHNGEKVDVLFVDTFHSRQQVLIELQCWLQHLSDKCVIFFHDVIWCHDTVKVLIDDLLKNFKTYRFCANFNEEESQILWNNSLGTVGLSEGRPIQQSNEEIQDAPDYANHRVISKPDYNTDENDFDSKIYDFKYELMIEWPGMIILTKSHRVSWNALLSTCDQII